MEQPWLKDRFVRQVQWILNSYRHWTGQELLPRVEDPREMAQSVFLARPIILSHGKEADPILNYGNAAALELWEMTWDSFIHTPSRLTAETLNREERKRLLQDVEQKGFSRNYHGERISSTGRRFLIEDAVIWNLLDEKGEYAGQAAAFSNWHYK